MDPFASETPKWYTRASMRRTDPARLPSSRLRSSKRLLSVAISLAASSPTLADPPDAAHLTPVPAASVPTEHPHSLTGDILLYQNFPARALPARNILVYLPPGYHDPINKRRRYSVLYLQDGQNCFDGATSFIPGKEWQVDETVERLIRAGEIEPIIIVGIYNTGMERMSEYTPVKDDRDRGGRASEYGHWIVDELKPFIDRTYRTWSDAKHTGIAGSSLGGLVSFYLGLTFPGTFQRVGAMSPSVWWADRAILRTANEIKERPPLRIWLDVGTEEGFSALPDVQHLRDVLQARGWTLEKDLRYMEASGAHHDEEAWGRRVEPMLRFLFPTRLSSQ